MLWCCDVVMWWNGEKSEVKAGSIDTCIDEGEVLIVTLSVVTSTKLSDRCIRSLSVVETRKVAFWGAKIGYLGEITN